ncbi:MAG: 3-oxoadipate enol-lactonase 2 [Chlamydiae bacterium]|nr:3-oxoadipate enol-lactonase 2 [Chlamydiota bacterium]
MPVTVHQNSFGNTNVRVEMAIAKVNEIEIYYEVHGEGPPLLCISGFSHHLKTWLPFIDLLSKSYQMILFDNRGSGRSSAPPPPYTIEMLADDLAGLMDALNIKSAFMLGSSMGGAVIQTLALKDPKRVKKGVLISPFAELPRTSLLKSTTVGKLLQSGAPLPLIIESIIPWLFSSDFISAPEKLKSKIEEMADNPYPPSTDGYLGQLHALESFNIRNKLKEITTPLLLIAGEHDLSTPLYCAEELELNLPHATLETFPRVGHMPHVECREAVAELITSFFIEP